MNKKLVLLLTFIVSFIVSIDVVWAAEKMTCTYDYEPRAKATGKFDTITLEQNKKGKITIKINNKKASDKWQLNDVDNNMENGSLKKCPPCAQFTKGYKISLMNVGSDKKCKDFSSDALSENPVLAGRKVSDTNWVKKCIYKNRSDKNKMIEIDFNKNNFRVVPNKNYIVKGTNYEDKTKKPYPGFTLPELIKVGAISNSLECPSKIFVSNNYQDYARITFDGCTSGAILDCGADYLELYDEEKEKSIESDDFNKEKSCEYVKYVGQNLPAKYRILQDINGVRKYYQRKNDGDELTEIKISNENYSSSSVYMEEKKFLYDCPKCFRIDGTEAIGSDATGVSNNGNASDFACLDSNDYKYDRGISNNQSAGHGKGASDEELNCDENWNMVCKYGYNEDHAQKLLLKFNSNSKEFILYRIGDSIPDNQIMSDINIDKILNINDGKCPENIYSFFDTLTEEFYLNDAKNDDKKPAKANRVYSRTSSKDCSSDGSGGKKTGWTINNCKQLFGDDLIEIIDKVMGYIKILVPILLLVFGTTDFFTAIFSSDQEEMISKRKKFFKRLIAAIIVFIVPTFVNLVLKLSNSVWSNIHEETCVDESDY